MTPDNISRLPPEYWQPIVSAAVRYFVNYGRPGSPGNREALFRIVKVALRYAHAGEPVQADEVRAVTHQDIAA